MKVNPNKKIISAATYGRGVWQSNLFCPYVNNYSLPESPNDFYAAISSINSTSTILSGRLVGYRAPEIKMEGGFCVQLGSEFSASSYSCSAFAPRSMENEDVFSANPDPISEPEIAQSLGLKVFPIPAKDELQVQYTLKKPSLIGIVLADVNGRIVKQVLNGQPELPGDFSKIIRIGDIPNGIYYLTVHAENNKETKLVFVQR